MSKIARVFQKMFGSTGTASFFGQPGSLPAGTKVNTQDPATIQALAAFLAGLESIVKSGTYKVAMEDLNSLLLLIFYQISYLMQAGIPEWDASTTYYTGSFCQVSGVIYKSLQDSNVNKTPASEAAWWVAVIDIDGTLTANSDVRVPSQKAVVTYVAARIAAIGTSSFGAWIDKTSNYGAQLAATDGIVVCQMTWSGGTDTQEYALGYTDGSANPGTLRGSASTHRVSNYSGGHPYSSFTMPVRKGEYWRITLSGSPSAFNVYFIPLGS